MTPVALSLLGVTAACGGRGDCLVRHTRSTVLAGARVAGEWEMLIETALECHAQRQVAGSRN